MKHLNCKLYYRQLHLKYLCNLARYWLQAVWGWHDSVETCSSVIICEIIVHFLVILQINKRCTVQVSKTKLSVSQVRASIITSQFLNSHFCISANNSPTQRCTLYIMVWETEWQLLALVFTTVRRLPFFTKMYRLYS